MVALEHIPSGKIAVIKDCWEGFSENTIVVTYYNSVNFPFPVNEPTIVYDYETDQDYKEYVLPNDWKVID